MPPLYDELMVSVQLAGHSNDPVAGHLAPGLLASPGFVVVPDPPDGLLDPHLALDVLIVPTPVTAGARIERLPVVAVQQLSRDDGRASMVVLGLDRDSRYEPNIEMHDEQGVEAAFRDGEVWSALEAAGAVRAGLRTLTPSDLGRLLPEVEQLQARPRWGESPVAISLWCLITRRCLPAAPHNPFPERPLPDPLPPDPPATGRSRPAGPE